MVLKCPKVWFNYLIGSQGANTHRKGNKKMAQKTVLDANSSTSPKVKVEKTEIVPMAEIVSAYSNLINHDGEIQFVLEIAEMLKGGKTSIRTVQASIAEASKIGNAPTIRKSHVQWFPIFSEIVGKISDAESQSVANLLKLSERVGREHGAEGAEGAISSVATVADLEKIAPTQTKSRTNAKSQKVSVKTFEGIISQALLEVRTLKNLKELKTSDLQTLTALLEICVPVAKRSMVKA
jgi:hypothetical protein